MTFGQVVHAETSQINNTNSSLSTKIQDKNNDIDSWMPNKDFQNEVLKHLIGRNQLNPGDSVNDITKEKVGKLGYLQLGPTTDKDYFKGIEYFTSLRKVYLQKEEDIEKIDFWNPIKLSEVNLEPLAKAPALTDICAVDYTPFNGNKLDTDSLSDLARKGEEQKIVLGNGTEGALY